MRRIFRMFLRRMFCSILKILFLAEKITHLTNAVSHDGAIGDARVRGRNGVCSWIDEIDKDRRRTDPPCRIGDAAGIRSSVTTSRERRRHKAVDRFDFPQQRFSGDAWESGIPTMVTGEDRRAATTGQGAGSASVGDNVVPTTID